MARKRWATPEQLAFIQSYLLAYDAAHKGVKKDLMRFWPILETAWFEKFPHKEEMAAKGELPREVLGSDYEWVKGSAEEAKYQKGLQNRKEVSLWDVKRRTSARCSPIDLAAAIEDSCSL